MQGPPESAVCRVRRACSKTPCADVPILTFALQILPAQREHVREQGAEIMVAPISVWQRVHDRGQLLDLLW
jgi:hypothetical protein